ncbi:MAG: prolipoprotein diacylglyceryl transferase [Acidobacteria bacterium]|nr:prolipoprotein diacylglyceryl transferase [Acidobacteriota bacterium]
MRAIVCHERLAASVPFGQRRPTARHMIAQLIERPQSKADMTASRHISPSGSGKRLMFPIFAEFGPVKLYSYGLMMALGFWIATQISSREFERRGGDADQFWRLALLSFVTALVTSHLWWWVGEAIAGRAGRVELLSGSGHVWFAGMIGGMVTGWWLARRRRLGVLQVLDSAALGLPLGHALGRIGCHLAGDGDWGRTTDVPWGVAYEKAIAGWPYEPGVVVHPTSLYETAAYTLVFGVLLLYRRRAEGGALLGACLVLTSIARFIIELWRLNPSVLGRLSEAQLVALALCAIGGWLWLKGSCATPSKAKP